MRRALLLSALAAGCRGPTECPSHADPAPDDAAAARPFDGDVFDPAVLHTIALTLAASDVDILLDDVDTEVPATLVFDGERVDDVGVGVRGGLGSYQRFDRKPKLGLDFNEFVAGGRFHGLKRLHLNNAQNDCSYLHEALAYQVYAQVGVPAARTAFAAVTVNGEDYGLYVLVEPPDDAWVSARFAEPGNLYDGRYLLQSKRWPFTRLDFGVGFDDLFPLEVGTNVAHADIRRVSDAALRAEAGGHAYDTLAEALDWGEVLREFAADQWSGQTDGYASFRNNYLVYFGEDGRVSCSRSISTRRSASPKTSGGGGTRAASSRTCAGATPPARRSRRVRPRR